MTPDVPLLDRVVHDLKGPLAPLQTAAYLLGRDDLPLERRRELLDTLERQSRRLALMIDETGDWVRASQQRLIGRRESCELALLVDMAVCGLSGCEVDIAVADDAAGRLVEGDQARLQQMLASLLKHACARGPESRASIAVTVLPDVVRLTIDDRGPTPDAAALTGLFVQPDPEPRDGGLGLRLLIAAAVAQAHGGRLQAQVAPDGGLRQVCELPLG